MMQILFAPHNCVQEGLGRLVNDTQIVLFADIEESAKPQCVLCGRVLANKRSLRTHRLFSCPIEKIATPEQIAHRIWQNKDWQKRSRKAITTRQHIYRATHPRDKARDRIVNQQWCEKNPARVKATRERTRDKLRLDVLGAYGNQCQCCGISESRFLAVDHIDGNGAAHKRSFGIKSAQAMYCWLRKNGFPPGFQLLCHNCNTTKSLYGGCPHDPTFCRPDPVSPKAKARRERAVRLRAEALAAYGNKCACCGEDRLPFLAIDHLNGGGAAHKRSLGIGCAVDFYRWLRVNEFPSGFQVLCHNCNMAKGFYGKCPHIISSRSMTMTHISSQASSAYVGIPA